LSNDGWTDVVLEHIQLVRHVDQLIHVTADGCNNDSHEILSKFGCDVQHHAVVQQDDSGIRPNQDISGMRIRMKEAVDQKLISIEGNQVLDHLFRIDIVPQDLFHLGHSEAFEELHDENACCRDFAIHPRDDHEVAIPEKFAESLDIIGLMMKVHFFRDHAREFFDDRPRGTNDVMVDELFQNEDQILNDSNIRRDEFFHAWPKYLHDDVLATVCGPVHLPERSCRERFYFKRVEYRIKWALQLTLDSFSDFTGWEWRDSIVEIPELFDIKL